MFSTWNSAQCYAAAWMAGAFGGEWIHVYMDTRVSLGCSPETFVSLLTVYTPIQYKKILLNKQMEPGPITQVFS